ncbi:MAG: hypothetical protein Ct9H90mP6_03830 [Gammaproteobacteria bacterium]|nr:MAG: hypothetical protein Ct9H90mP6_03830 [Gammaproteobacteria bacterium]
MLDGCLRYAQEMYAKANKEYQLLMEFLLSVIEAWGDFKEDLIQVDKLGSMQSDAVFIAQTQDIINLDFNTARSNIF